MSPRSVLVALLVLLASWSEARATRVCHENAWLYHYSVRLNHPPRYIDHAGSNSAQQAFQEVVPQVTKAIKREGHIPKGAQLVELLPIEGCFKSVVPATPKRKQFGQYGFYFKAVFSHGEQKFQHYIGAWSDNKRKHPQVEVWRYKLY